MHVVVRKIGWVKITEVVYDKTRLQSRRYSPGNARET